MLWRKRPPAPIGSRTARLADLPPVGALEDETSIEITFHWLIRAKKPGRRTRHYMRRTWPVMEETIKELRHLGWRVAVYRLPR